MCKRKGTKEIRVKYHHECRCLCQTTFKAVGRPRYYNRLDQAGWFTVYPSKGYWESESQVRDDITFKVVDGNGNTLFTESNANLGSFQSVSDRASQFAKEWSEMLRLSDYDTWKKWLSSDMKAHGYTGYVDNWLHANNKTVEVETIGSYEHLGLDFGIVSERMEHTICGKMWHYVYIENLRDKETVALCGFILA
jgi:hypothetical protein